MTATTRFRISPLSAVVPPDLQQPKCCGGKDIGSWILLSGDSALPYDRPNLSKDYLAGTAPFDYVPLKDERFYEENNIETRLGQRFSRSTSALARSSSPTAKEFPTTGFSWPREQNRSSSRFRAPTYLMSILSVADRLSVDH